MTSTIVQTPTFLTLLGAGSTQFRHFNQLVNKAPILVAADGGADVALRAGLTPDAVIGDLDSISDDARSRINVNKIHHVAEQDSTDFEKCLMRVEAKAVLALGFTGGRLDHELAACTALVRHPRQLCILLGETDLCFLSPLSFEINLPVGTRFSLYPMGEVSGTSEGLKYPIAGIAMSPGTRVGTSNAVTGPVRVTFDRRRMLIILPVTTLDAVLDALT